ncbi:permease [Candidatus Liberibacter americanus str. Sao Paulo]|uniref:Probable membrane transporter protein n=2 Tax=Candidatus Liberibacter americanus TaxID=309868 RepID=U6B574_9HYPH|nr:permease [Candidatus Liberibacter americanus str. Sao Paulo]
MGGGLVMVPILAKAFQLSGVDDSICMHVAMGTSLGVIAPTSILSFIEHKRHGTVDMRIFKSWIIVLPVSSLITSILTTRLDNNLLKIGFSVFCCFIGFLMIFKNYLVFKYDFPDNYLKYVWGIIIGIFSGAMGVGGGILSAIIMLLCGRSINQATAISAGVSLLITIPGLFVRIYSGWGELEQNPMSLGYVDVLTVLTILPISFIVSPISTKISYMMEKRHLEFGFSLVMFFVAFSFI